MSIEPGEGRTLLLLVAHSFLIGFARLFMETAADAIFLGEQEVTTLPYVFIGIALVGVLVGLVVGRAERFLSFKSFLTFILASLLVSVAALWLALQLLDSGGVPIAIAIWNDSVEVLTALELGALAGRLFNVRQAKRLYAIIGCGDVLAGLIGGLAVPIVVESVGTPPLLLLACGSMLLALVLMRCILATTPQQPEEEEDEAAEPSTGDEAKKQRLLVQLKDKYLLLILGVATFDVIIYFLLQAAFLADSRARYPDEDQLASFFGVVFGLASVATLICRTAISARFLRRFGVVGGLVIVPLVLSLGVATAAVTGITLPAGSLVFWAVIVSRMTYAVVFDSIGEPSNLMLYQPLSPRKRLWTQAFVDTFCMPVVTGLSGVVLIVFMLFRPMDGRNLAWLLLASVLAWIVVGLKAGRQYTDRLIQALARRSLPGLELTRGDATTLALLEAGLTHSRPGAAIYALNMLEQLGYERLESALVDLLDRPELEVRLEALRRIELRHAVHALPAVEALLRKEDDDPPALSAAVRTFVSLGEAGVLDAAAVFLENQDSRVRAGAMVGLLRYGGIDGVLLAGPRLMQMVDSDDPAARAGAAAILGEIGIHNFYRPLVTLLHDPDVHVRISALEAAPKIGNPDLWPEVVALLNADTTAVAAANALAKVGAPALPALAAPFDDTWPNRARVRAAQVAGRIKGPDAVSLLEQHLDFPNRTVRDHVLASLAACGYQAEGAQAERVWQCIREEAAHTAWTLSCLLALWRDDLLMLQRALTTERKKSRDHVLLLLSFVFPSHAVLRARDTLRRGSEDRQGYALEVLDNLLSPAVKALLLPIVEDLSVADAYSRLSGVLPPIKLSEDEAVASVVDRPDGWISAWTRETALDAAERLNNPRLRHRVLAAAHTPASLPETAAMALSEV